MIVGKFRPDDGLKLCISENKRGTLGARARGALPARLPPHHVRLAKPELTRHQHGSSAA